MKTLILKSLLLIALIGLAAPAMAGNCDHSWQSAADGSNCGTRSADSRPGGRSPYNPYGN